MIGFASYIVCFIILCLGVAVVVPCIRGRDAKAIRDEAMHLFMMMFVGIIAFSGVVYILEWMFNRRI